MNWAVILWGFLFLICMAIIPFSFVLSIYFRKWLWKFQNKVLNDEPVFKKEEKNKSDAGNV